MRDVRDSSLFSLLKPLKFERSLEHFRVEPKPPPLLIFFF